MAKKSISVVPWNRVSLATVTLISGPENFLASEVFNQIRHKISSDNPDYSLYEIEAENYEAGQLVTFASPSLFGEARLIRVNGVEKANDLFLKEAKDFLSAAQNDAIIVFRHEKGVRGKALLDQIRSSKDAVEVSCAAVSPRDRANLVKDYASFLGGQIDFDAARAILEAFQGSLDELLGAVRQLIDSSSGARITLNMVTTLTGGRVETNAFKVADAAISGNSRNALVLLRQALSTGTQPIPLLAAINLKIRTMVKVFGAHEPTSITVKKFGLQPWQVERARKDVYSWDEENLAKVLELGADTEEKLKGGSLDPLYALEKYVLSISLRGKKK